MNEELEKLLASWTETIIHTLNDAEIRESILLLDDDQKHLIQQFTQSKRFSFPVDVKLVQTLKELFEGIRKVELSIDSLLEMAGNGHPLTLDELRKRFESLVKEQVGSDNRVRILLRKGDI